jgi:hypothetical protein
MIFNGNDAWFIPPTSKYGLSRVNSNDLHLGDFTFLVRVKVDWDFLIPNTKTQEVGIMIKNGKHLGISIAKTGNNYRILKGMCWTEKRNDTEIIGEPSENATYEQILLPLNAETDISNDYMDISISFNLTKKLFKLSANDFEISQEFIYDLADYSSSWLWVGVANPLDSCPEEHRHYFKGDISFCGVFQTYMDSKDIKRAFDGKWEKSDRPVAVYNFEKLTPYKVLDITKNGNNLINYDKRWMTEN